jgi:hypothetical protein
MKDLLLPYPMKILGWFLVIAGTLLAVIYLQFDFNFKMPVFAVISSFLETRMFVTFRTNVADELILLLLVSGFGLWVCSKEKNESEFTGQIRSIAWVKAMVANTVFLVFSVLFFYGSGFIAVLVINLFTPAIFYLGFFYYLKRKLLIRK